MSPDRPTVHDVLPLARTLYESPGGGVGCCLHIVLDDGNVEDGNVQYCLAFAEHRGHPRCIELARLLLRMTPTQRAKVSDKL